MHLILTAATGHVGVGVLDAMIKAKGVSKISILSSRPVEAVEDANDSRINVIVHEDFMKYDDALLEQLKGADGAVWAPGVSLAAVSQKEYIKITKDYPIAAARAFRRIPQDRRKPFRFIYVTGDNTPNEAGSLRPFCARVKAETILTLAEMRRTSPMFHASTVRPGILEQPEHNATNGHVPLQGLVTAATEKLLLPSTRASVDRGWRPTDPLGVFLRAMVMGKLDGALLRMDVKKIGAFPIVENADIRQLTWLGG